MSQRVAVEVSAIWPEDVEADEGVVVDWFVREGGTVREGETLCTFQVEKVSVDVPAPVAGTLVELLVGEDEELARGDTLGWLEAD